MNDVYRSAFEVTMEPKGHVQFQLLGALNGRGDTVHNESQESQCVWCEILARTVEVKEATTFKSVDDTREAPFHTGNQLEPKWLRLTINNVINHHNLFTRTPRKYHHD